jgi:hypothetical protein
LFFSPSLATTKNESAIGSRKEKGKNIFPLSLILLRNEASSNRGRARDDRISNIERRHRRQITSPRDFTSNVKIADDNETSRDSDFTDNVDYDYNVPDDIAVEHFTQESPGSPGSKSKSQKQDQIIIKRQTEIKKNNKVHLK